ncbi:MULTISPECIES: serine hydrolase domain-containing protein [unclassified Leifsonia]|uniref:serine hydrolase domain-containing protein n=1 Tax=unclassified Leifsonia TaxID=2663824 RepID=UPI0006F6A79D|nr:MULTISPECIES: serine hydrolase domain-containing protein [unclassified Leifsonia]KQX05094.1 hypothetical protein ASC59_12795 [Leifsonia sp. Root1293]KRA08726.1 hypothetical protein ASD61_12795 [Leifsonia sp. Root60]
MTGRTRARGFASAAILAVVALVVTACSSTGAARAALPEQVDTPFGASVEESLSDALKNAIALSDATGGVAGVWAPWSGQWLAASGKLGLKDKSPVTTDTHFRIGELTQGMTCTVLMRLVDEKVVSLDDFVSHVLPSIPGTAGITLGQLCQGTSGIADTRGALGAQFSKNPERPWPPIEIVSNALALPRTGAPGEKWAPSDGGYMLLGLALEAATGRSWSDLEKQYVLDPLGLDETTIPGESTIEVPGAHPAGYVTPVVDGAPKCDAIRAVSKLSPSMAGTSGGAVSTVPELKVLVQSLASGTTLTEKTHKLQWKTVPLGGEAPQWERQGYGGTQIGPLRGGSGNFGGYISAAYSDPSSGLTVVVMLNNATAGREFAKNFALQLASLGARTDAAAKSGLDKPVIELPWSAEQMADKLKAAAICVPKGD